MVLAMLLRTASCFRAAASLSALRLSFSLGAVWAIIDGHAADRVTQLFFIRQHPHIS